jgi:hypothetical protein
VQQQPLLLAQGLEAAFKAAAVTRLLQQHLLKAAGTAALLLQKPVLAAAAAYLQPHPQQGSDAAAATAQVAAAAATVSHDTAAFSMLLSGLRSASKAAAQSTSVLSNPDSLIQCAEVMQLIPHLLIPQEQQSMTIIKALMQLQQLNTTHDAVTSSSAERTAAAVRLLLGSIQHSTVLAATALHALAGLLLSWQASNTSRAAAASGSTGLRRSTRTGRTNTQSSSSSSSSSVTTAKRNEVMGVVRDHAADHMLTDLPRVLSTLVGHLDDAFIAVRDETSKLVVRDGTNRLDRGAAGFLKLQQQVLEIKAALAEVGSTQVPRAAEAIAAVATPAAVVATAAAAYDSHMLQQLQRYTAAVAATMPAAVLGTCSNIACTNTAPCVKLSQCSKCKACFFCGTECQVGESCI